MRVGEIDYYQFIITYGFILIIGYFIVIPMWVKNVQANVFYFDIAGVLVGLFVGVHIFNIYKPSVSQYTFEIFDYPRRGYKIYYYYAYYKDDEEYIIHYEYEGREAVTDFLKRMFGYKIKLLFTDSITILFREIGGKGVLHLLNDLRIVRAPVKILTYNAEGDLVKVLKRRGVWKFSWVAKETILEAEPIEATSMTELEFLVNYGRYLRLSAENADLQKQLMIAEEMQDSEIWKKARLIMKFKKAVEQELQLGFQLENIDEAKKRLLAMQEEETNHEDEGEIEIPEEALVRE